MKKIFCVFLFCTILIIVIFLLFGDVEKWVALNLNNANSKSNYIIISFSLLTSDIVLPIPSSLIMILNGKVLGCFWGTILSLTSGVLSSSIGYYLGKISNPILDKIFTEKEKKEGNRLFNNFGNNAIIISKALPIISEAVSFVSGTTSISFRTFFFYSLVGHILISFAYAFIGSYSTTINSNIVSAIVIITSLIIGWTIQKVVRKKNGT